jgi:hypothetical protein
MPICFPGQRADGDDPIRSPTMKRAKYSVASNVLNTEKLCRAPDITCHYLAPDKGNREFPPPNCTEWLFQFDSYFGSEDAPPWVRCRRPSIIVADSSGSRFLKVLIQLFDYFTDRLLRNHRSIQIRTKEIERDNCAPAWPGSQWRQPGSDVCLYGSGPKVGSRRKSICGARWRKNVWCSAPMELSSKSRLIRAARISSSKTMDPVNL